MAGDDRVEFEAEKRAHVKAMAADPELNRQALDLVIGSDRYGYSTSGPGWGSRSSDAAGHHRHAGEVIWANRPQVVIETGVARGGSVILSSSLLELIGEGEVIAIDIDIRPHNLPGRSRRHPARPIGVHLDREGSVDRAPAVVGHESGPRRRPAERVMVVLDSNHTHEHVLAELEAYAGMVSPGQYLVVADTVVEHIPEQVHRPRPWGPGEQPPRRRSTSSRRAPHLEFEDDDYLNAKLLADDAPSPGGYLRRRDRS